MLKKQKKAAVKLKEAGIEFDVAYTSVLTRAIKTCNYLLEYSDQLWVPQIKSWRLNERHYGKLQGLNKKKLLKNTETNKSTSGVVLTILFLH